MRIEPGAPAVTRAPLAVSGAGEGAVAHLSVTVELEHRWQGDLALSLLSPDGRASCSRGAAAGGRTTSAGRSSTPSRRSRSPTRSRRSTGAFARTATSATCAPATPTAPGRSRSTTAPSTTPARSAAGACEIETAAQQEPAFVIDVRFKGGLTSAQQAAFTSAAARWSRIITADVPSVIVDGETIDDVVIDADGVAIDGPGGILGQAGPTQLRPGSFLPAAGVMSFDTADLRDDGGRRQPRQRHHARDGPRARLRHDLGRARAAPGRRHRRPDVHRRQRDARVRHAERRPRDRAPCRSRTSAAPARATRTGARRSSATSS